MLMPREQRLAFEIVAAAVSRMVEATTSQGTRSTTLFGLWQVKRAMPTCRNRFISLEKILQGQTLHSLCSMQAWGLTSLHAELLLCSKTVISFSNGIHSGRLTQLQLQPGLI